MIALLIVVQSITQITYIPRIIVFNSINNNNKDTNFSQLFPYALCHNCTTNINKISSTHRIHP